MSPARGRAASRRARRRLLVAGLAAAMAALAAPESARAQPRPDPPQNLSAEAVSASQINLTWEPGEEGATPVSYNIYRGGVQVGSSPVTSFQDTGLAPGTEYTYRVTAVDDKARESNRSDPASATTFPDDTPPTTPTGLSATPVSSTRIDLAWSPSTDPESGISEYRVYRDGSQVGTAAGTSFEDTGLDPFTLYEYRVSAVNGGGLESGQSAPASARTLDGTPPTTPVNLVATPVSGSEIDLRWDASGDPETGVTGYRVYRDGVQVATTAATSFRDSGLAPFTEYEYRVSAVNGQGLESQRSAPATARTLDTTPPSTPTGLSGTPVSSTSIDLSWSPSSDPQSGVAEYRIYRNGVRVGVATSTAFRDTGLSPFTVYQYRVSAVNGAGLESAQSAPVSVRTLDGTPPTKPQGLTATAVSSSEIGLTWSPASDAESGIAGYRVYRDGAPAGTTSETSFLDTGLEQETEYEYRVSAVNGDGLEGDRSDPAKATTPRPDDTTPPTRPEGLQAEALSPRQVNLSWLPSTDPETGVARYRVFRDGVAVGSPTETSFLDSGLTPDTQYEYRVSAVNGDGLESERSDPATVRTPEEVDDTPPSAPGSLSAAAVSPTRIDLQWTAAEDPESGISGYNVYRDDVLVDTAVGTSYADLGLLPATTYSYQVSAVNGEGLEGARSSAASATTPADADVIPPAPPTGLRVISP